MCHTQATERGSGVIRRVVGGGIRHQHVARHIRSCFQNRFHDQLRQRREAGQGQHFLRRRGPGGFDRLCGAARDADLDAEVGADGRRGQVSLWSPDDTTIPLDGSK